MSDFVFTEQQDSFGFSDAHDDFDWKETAKGDPGATFIPDVSEQGIISWTNDGGLPNPQPRNIRGPKGDSLDLPQGGETGQILKKLSDEDYDVEWADAAEAQVQSDWTETDTDEPSYIQHKPDLSHFIDDSDYAPTAKTQDMVQPVGVDANGALWTAPGGDASSDMIADEYDDQKVDGYAVGDYCYRDGTLYRCNTAIPAGGETWTPAHWDECTVTGEIQTLQEDFSEFDEMSGIAVQDTAPSGRIKMWLDTDGNPIVLPEIDDEHTNLVDTWSSQKISNSIGAVDDSLANVQSGLAIIVDGDTCTTAVPVGGYAYIRNNTHGLAEGLYTNSSASAFPTTGGTADGTVFTAVSSGGLNALKTAIDSKVNTSAVANNLTTTAAGYVLDARQGKTLNDSITSLIEGGAGYVKLPDGTMIQYGATTVTASGTMAQILSSGIYYGVFDLNFPKSFASNSYRVVGSARYSTGFPFTFAGIPSTSGRAIVYVYDFYARAMNDGHMMLQWIAIGRWK